MIPTKILFTLLRALIGVACVLGLIWLCLILSFGFEDHAFEVQGNFFVRASLALVNMFWILSCFVTGLGAFYAAILGMIWTIEGKITRPWE